MYKVILFDFDGTIFDTVEGISKCARYAINKQGLDAPLEELRCFAGPPLVDKFAEVFGFDHEHAYQAMLDFEERYRPIGMYECRVFPGVREAVEKLRRGGLRVGIATSKPEILARILLERNGMTDCFEVICGTQAEVGNSKKREIVQRAIEEFGAGKSETVLVGDTKYDVIGAHECGIDCIGVRYGYAAPGELEEAGADCIVNDLDELADHLLQ